MIFKNILGASKHSLVSSGYFIMTSLTNDLDGTELVEFAPLEMDSLDVGAISNTEWKQFSYNMQIFDPAWMKRLAKSCNPKLLRRFFSSDMATRNLHEAAKLGKSDVMKVLLSLRFIDINKIDNAGMTALHYATREGHLEIVSMLLEERNIDVSLRDGDGNTSLHNAAKHGNVLVFDMLLKARKVDVNSTNDYGETALLLSAERGYEKIVDILLKVPNVVVISKDHQIPPLHAAARHGHASIVEMLLGKMDVNSTNSWLASPLHVAIEGGHENVVDVLLQAPNVNPFLKDWFGNTPLHIAVEKGNEAIFEKLLHIPGVGVNSVDNKGKTILHLAAFNKHENIVIKLMKEKNVDLCAKMDNDTTPLHMAAEVGGVDVIQVLLATGKIDVNITDSKKRTALHCATEQGHLNVVEVLLKVPNVSPCLGDEEENIPLHLATKLGHQGVVERLLVVPHLDMVNKVNKQNETPLFLAARHGSINVVDLLLENPKVDLSICDHHGDSPFHAALKGGHTNIAEKLITSPRAFLLHSNKENLTALHLCIRGGHENLVDIFLKQSIVDASAKDVCGDFPIHYAAQNGNACILQKILNAHGVDVNSVNDHLDTPLHLAAKTGHIDVVDVLLQVPTLNASMQDRDGNSALHVAAKYGEEEIVEKLLKVKEVNVNAKGEHGFSALCFSACEGYVRIVDKLLEVHDVLNNEEVLVEEEDEEEPSENNWGVLALLLAARNGHATIIKSLLAHGVDVNGAHIFSNKTALLEAIEYRHSKAVEVLLGASDIDPNRRYMYDEHPLFVAAKDGQKSIVEKLIATGQIGVNVLSNGRSALQIAAEKGREQVVKILLKTPDIDVHIKSTFDGETALFDAARANNKTILKDIYNASKINVGSEKHSVETQLNINDKNYQGESIIHLAARQNLLNVIDFLLEVVHDDARSVDVNLETSPPFYLEVLESGFIPKSALQIATDAHHYSIVEKLTKFESISFTQEVDGKTVLQYIFDQKQWETFNIVRRTPEVTNYIDALYKDRQANIDAANAILVGAALIASITFASWLQPPLGYSTYYHEQFSDSLPAPPISYPEYVAFDHHPSLQAFWVFNSLSFFSAIATVISGARSVLPAEKIFIKQEVENLRWNLLKTSILLGFSMFFVLLAFATAGVVVLPPIMKFRTNIFSTIAIGGCVCFMFLFSFGKIIYKLRFDIKSSQAKKIGFIERWGLKIWHMANSIIRSRGSKD